MKGVLAFCLSVLLVLSGCAGTGSALKPGARVPYTKFQMLDGQFVLLDSLKGKNVALLFWATTCRNSKAAIRNFNQQAKDLADRKDVVFLAASLDENQDRDNLEAFLVKENITSVANAFSGNGPYDEAYLYFHCEFIPQSFLIGPDGKVIASDNELDFKSLLTN